MTALDFSPAQSMAFQLHAVLQVGQGGSAEICSTNVLFSPGEDDATVLGRAASQLTATPSCATAGLKANFVNNDGPRTGEDGPRGARISLSAPTLAGSEILPSVLTVPGVATGACFAFDELGNTATHALLISQLNFSTLANGARGGTVRVTEQSSLGDCAISVPTTSGQSASAIASAVNQALATSSASCPALKNPLDASVTGNSIIFIAASQIVVCIDDPGVGFSFQPKEVTLTDICAAGVDKTKPTFTAVPPAITISACTSPNIGQAVAFDACGATVTNDAPAKFPLGTTTVTWTAVDPAGNRATATQKVSAILGDDPSCCPTGTNVMLGTAASDNIIGTEGSDCILARGGDDVIDARGGNDFVSGGVGRDNINGGFGNDVIFGGDGDDTIDSSVGDDFVDGGAGVNTCSGGTGTNKIVNCTVTSFCNASCCATNTCSL
jgi:hypothetical protein